MGKSKKYGTLFIFLLVCFFACAITATILNNNSKSYAPLFIVMIGASFLFLTLSVFAVIIYIKERSKTGRHENKEFEFAKQKQSLEIRKDELAIERDHTDKSQFRQCARCGSRVPLDAVRCPSCGG